MFKCYFASPFFRESQIEREERVKKLLRDFGVDVYSPKEHGIVNNNMTQEDMRVIFKENLKAIQDCDFVFAITDEKDMGTIWEAGYAFGIKKPIIYYCETLGDNSFNIMLSKSGIAVYNNFNELHADLIENGTSRVCQGRGNWNIIDRLKGF